MAIKIYFIRHGQTDFNLKELVYTKEDVSLNETGIRQVLEARKDIEGINFDIVYCSPLLRTKQTMELVTENKFPVIFDNRLVERTAGEYMGLHQSTINREKYWNYYDDTEYEEVQNVRDFVNIVSKFLDELKENYTDETILLVTHGGVFRAAEVYFNGIPEDGDMLRRGHKNCEVRKYILESKKEN